MQSSPTRSWYTPPTTSPNSHSPRRSTLRETLSISVTLTNTGRKRYSLDGLTVTIPIPEHVNEHLVFEGRWSREFQQVRRPWHHGDLLIENRRGRTSHETPSLLFVGEAGFDEWDGEVRGVHCAWSGNHTMLAQRLADGRRYVQAGELLHPGEIVPRGRRVVQHPACARGVLAPRSHAGDVAVPRRRPGVAGRSHDAASGRAEHLGSGLLRPRRREALAHSPTLQPIWASSDSSSTTAGSGRRRDDTRGLGDWWVSNDVYPDGLAPLIDHVTGLGMEFGIWVEPEMVNPDSDVFRAHPEWALTTDGYDAGARSPSTGPRPRRTPRPTSSSSATSTLCWPITTCPT